MSVRKRLLKSYLILILLALFYIAFSFALSSFRLTMERDRNTLLEVNIDWGNLLMYLHESVSDWDDGDAYEQYLVHTRTFSDRLSELINADSKLLWYRKDVFSYIDNLNNVWQLAQVSNKQLSQTRESPAFLAAEKKLETELGLQRLYSIYMKLIFDEDSANNDQALAVKEYIDAVEFFPIYSVSMNQLFDIIFEKIERGYEQLQMTQNVVGIVFFALFITGLIYATGHFTNSLARPIITVSKKLNSFIGKSMAPRKKTFSDELDLLEDSVDDLILHYTNLSKLALRLSDGRIETSLLDLPREGVVGNAMKEIAAYLKELATAADWIREGKYGLQVREKSPHDVLARSFNIMSKEIAEKLSTLTNMFETIEEGVFLTDMNGTVMVANQHFMNLMAVESQNELQNCDFISRIGMEDEELLGGLKYGKIVKDKYCYLLPCTGERIPVKMNIRPLTDQSGSIKGVMTLVSNESLKIRMRREQEKLSAQAVEAELRALRAQINPHFFFNTLNSIAQLIEKDSRTAVRVVEKLADLFRYSLLSTKRSTVPLEDEILHIREYLDIEAIRHDERLFFHIDLDESARLIEIPPMLMQPIVENAIKYGADIDGNIDISVSARIKGDQLKVSVCDRGMDEVSFEKLLNNDRTGLNNINQRLMTLYRRRLDFNLPAEGGLEVCINIPCEGGV